MRVLFIGGTGIISSACSALAVERGIELYLLTRGETLSRPAPPGAHLLRGDIRDLASARAAIGDREFDAVVQWLAFTPDHIEADLELFSGRVGQYVLISSASVYEKPPRDLPITEATPLVNPFWQYARDKIACEERARRAAEEAAFPVTIVRPAHTYDRTKLPIRGGYTMIDRMRRGEPGVIHGDGTSLWPVMHHTDFARAFVPLLGESRAIGEAYHITSDRLLTWNAIFEAVAAAAGTQLIAAHVPSDWIAEVEPGWGASLLGDKAHSMIFDNSKIRSLAPDVREQVRFEHGAEEALTWYDEDPARRVVDAEFDAVLDQLVALAAPRRAQAM